MKQSLKVTVITALLAAPMILPMASASAFNFGDMQKTLIQRLAQKFNLKQTDVETVFNQAREDHQADMQKRLEDRLTQAVKDGKITEAQKQSILAKHKEIQKQKDTNIAAWQNMTPEEKREAMQKTRTELETWAKKNNIDIRWLLGNGMGMGRMGRHMWK